MAISIYILSQRLFAQFWQTYPATPAMPSPGYENSTPAATGISQPVAGVIASTLGTDLGTGRMGRTNQGAAGMPTTDADGRA
jgi:hypothetical protein